MSAAVHPPLPPSHPFRDFSLPQIHLSEAQKEQVDKVCALAALVFTQLATCVITNLIQETFSTVVKGYIEQIKSTGLTHVIIELFLALPTYPYVQAKRFIVSLKNTPTNLEQPSYQELYKDPGKTLQEKGLGGLKVPFETIITHVLIAMDPYYASMGLTLNPSKGILLYGPPGTGKTALAEKLADILKASKVSTLSSGDLLDKYVGESERKIRNLFASSEKKSLHVIIINEIDTLISQRSEGENSRISNKVCSEFLNEMDKLKDRSDTLVIGTTNRLQSIDGAQIRGGRFDLQIEIPLPNDESRAEIIEIYREKYFSSERLEIDEKINFENLVSETIGFSGADIEAMMNKVLNCSIMTHARQENSKESKIQISKVNLDKVLQDARLSLEQRKRAPSLLSPL